MIVALLAWLPQVLAWLPAQHAALLRPCDVRSSTVACRAVGADDLAVFCNVPMDEDEAISQLQQSSALEPLVLLLPLAAYFGYDQVVNFVTWFVDTFSPGDWVAVDGGQAQVQMSALSPL